MNSQRPRERKLQAVIKHPVGARQASINVAEGDKQSTILRAEGDKQSAILRAEGERQAQALRAEGYGTALTTIFGAASGVDDKTMQIQYLEVLRTLANSESKTWIVPMEVTELTRRIGATLGGCGS